MTISPTAHKVKHHFMGELEGTQPHSAKIKPKQPFTCIDVSAGDEKQEDLKLELLPGGGHDYSPRVLSAGSFLTAFSSPSLLHRMKIKKKTRRKPEE